MPREEIERINALSEQQVADYLRRSSVTYLECCMSLMLTHMTRAEVVAILRAEAEMVENLG